MWAIEAGKKFAPEFLQTLRFIISLPPCALVMFIGDDDMYRYRSPIPWNGRRRRRRSRRRVKVFYEKKGKRFCGRDSPTIYPLQYFEQPKNKKNNNSHAFFRSLRLSTVAVTLVLFFSSPFLLQYIHPSIDIFFLSLRQPRTKVC